MGTVVAVLISVFLGYVALKIGIGLIAFGFLMFVAILALTVIF